MNSRISRISPAQAVALLTRLDTTGLTTKDFATLGYGFEMFLRYAQLSPRRLVVSHNALRPALEQRAAE